MQPHQLEYFLAVAETGSFTRGAQRSAVVQSAVSAAIAQLERELGTPLLERGYHRVSLTAAGEALLPRAREVLSAIEAAREAVASTRGEVVGTVTLGTLAYTGSWDLAGLLQEFSSQHPKVAVHLRQTIGGTATSLDAVRTGLLDLALVATPATELPGLALTEIHQEPMVFLCHREHRLASVHAVSVTDLVDEPFIDFPTGWGNRTQVDNAFAAAGATRTIRTEVTDFALARALIRNGLGVTILPANAVDDSVAHVPLREPMDWTIRLARSTSRREGTAALRLAETIMAHPAR